MFAYSVGNCEVLESPSFERVGPHPVFTRTFAVSPTRATLSLSVLQAPDGPATSLERIDRSPNHGYVRVRSGSEERTVGFRGLPAGAQWRLAQQHLILDLPALEGPVRFSLSIGPVTTGGAAVDLVAAFLAPGEVTDLAALCAPGPARWTVLETRADMGEADGPFAVDRLTIPVDNPWKSYLRLSALDFLDEHRAVVTSLSGDVWIVASDNEGNWVPTSKVTRIERGGFHGFIPSAQRDVRPDAFVKPCRDGWWLNPDRQLRRSPAVQ